MTVGQYLLGAAIVLVLGVLIALIAVHVTGPK